jgi:hypothetical protein
VAAAALLALSAAARAETIEKTLGPFVLKGKAPVMAGPEAATEVRFAHAGFVTGFSARILDSRFKPRDHEGLHCHSALTANDSARSRQRYKGSGLVAESARFVLNEGLGDIRLPDGFGVPVDSVTAYSLNGMLEDDEGLLGGIYTVKYRVEEAPADPPLKALTGLMLLVRRDAPASAHLCDTSVWPVPPGLHEYDQPFTMPYTARVHLIAAHLHRFVREISIRDEASGETVYKAAVELNATGYPQSVPVYSSAEGLPLRGGSRYTFRVVYDNPTSSDSVGAGALRLYVREDS